MISSSLNKILILLLIAAAGVFGAHQFMERRFCLEHICYAEAGMTKDALPPPASAQELSALSDVLAQPFTYLDRGKQSYAFISRDGRYVLKFFDFHRMQRRAAIEVAHADKREAIRQKRLHQLVQGYDTAYRYAREHAGLVFVQLSPSDEIDQQVIVRDSMGVKHRIPLAQTPFVVQHVAVPARIEIASLLERGDLEKAKRRFRSILEMYIADYQNSLYDADHNVMYNSGFVGEAPIRIDLGRLRKSDTYKDPAVFRPDLDKIVFQRIDGWLQRHFPLQREDIVNDLKGYLRDVAE